jgi:hypothetical protein
MSLRLFGEVLAMDRMLGKLRAATA